MRIHLPKKSDFSSLVSYYTWSFIAFLILPLTLHPRFYDLNNPLIEPHPWRQNQTALTAYYFNKGFGTVFDYRSPYGGKLWNYVIEFPLYQWLVAHAMQLGFSLEMTGRLISVLFFFVGSIYLYKITEKIFSKEIALWSFVFYTISPFNIVYSRTVLIDLMVQCFCLMSAYYLVCLEVNESKKKNFILSVLFGILASTGKVTVWFSVGLTAFFYLCYCLFYQKEKLEKHKYLIYSLCLQGIIGFSWMKWSTHVLGITGDFNAPRWFFGELYQRIEGWRWVRLFNIVGRSILSDFLVLPFLFAILATRKYVVSRLILLLVIFIPVLILFNIHVHHDYYFITETPYIFVLAGIGMASLMTVRKKLLLYVSLSLMVFVFGWRIKHLDSILGIIYHDFRPQISEILTLKSMTEPTELIYYHSDSIGHLEIPFYSERSVLLGPSRFFGKEAHSEEALVPTVFWLRTNVAFDYLDSYPTLSLQTHTSGFHILRSQLPDGSLLDPKKAVSVSNLPDATALVFKEGEKEINSCNAKNNYAAFKLPNDVKRIELYSEATKQTYTLPAKQFLYLPSVNPIGCRFTVSLLK